MCNTVCITHTASRVLDLTGSFQALCCVPCYRVPVTAARGPDGHPTPDRISADRDHAGVNASAISPMPVHAAGVRLSVTARPLPRIGWAQLMPDHGAGP